LNRARLLFLLVSIYIVAAFSWWTYAHYKSSKTIYELERKGLESHSYEASFDVEMARQQELFEDSTAMKNYFYAHHPKHELFFIPQGDPLYNFMVRPKWEAYQELETIYKRKVRMFILEGAVMMALIFWGLIRIFYSLSRDLKVKRNQRNFLLSVTHELKTPLTSIKLYLETLLKRKLSEEQTRTIVQNSLQESERLNLLVENLLLSARLESAHFDLDIRNLNLSELTEETVRNFAIPRNLNERISMEIEPSVYVKADPNAMEIILTNLLSNALKYTPEGSQIQVRLLSSKQEVRLQILDEGPGISEEDKKELFTKFFRIGDENTRKTKGTGLGLFIVKNLANLQKAEIQVENRLPKGSIFELRLKNNG